MFFLYVYTIYAAEIYNASDDYLVVTNELFIEGGCLKGKVAGSVTQSGSKDAFDELLRCGRVRPGRCVVIEDVSKNASINVI